jgi:hypothetical protein
MAATKKKIADTSQTWIVDLDGTPTEVIAESFEMTELGLVFCNADEDIVRAIAPGHWTTVELKPPADETPES